ncbi:MAG: hypothetical protein IGR92_12040 [Leptolyngbyaceae cyanobacterium T60_A2020_046]|nr:hypothetical protein [Leptolyngbyaceae cyanobacterium T60_A2020_046]
MTIETTIEKILATRRITRHDQLRLMQLFSKDDITSADKILINRVYEALSQGRLRVVD